MAAARHAAPVAQAAADRGRGPAPGRREGPRVAVLCRLERPSRAAPPPPPPRARRRRPLDAPPPRGDRRRLRQGARPLPTDAPAPSRPGTRLCLVRGDEPWCREQRPCAVGQLPRAAQAQRKAPPDGRGAQRRCRPVHATRLLLRLGRQQPPPPAGQGRRVARDRRRRRHRPLNDVRVLQPLDAGAAHAPPGAPPHEARAHRVAPCLPRPPQPHVLEVAALRLRAADGAAPRAPRRGALGDGGAAAEARRRGAPHGPAAPRRGGAAADRPHQREHRGQEGPPRPDRRGNEGRRGRRCGEAQRGAGGGAEVDLGAGRRPHRDAQGEAHQRAPGLHPVPPHHAEVPVGSGVEALPRVARGGEAHRRRPDEAAAAGLRGRVAAVGRQNQGDAEAPRRIRAHRDQDDDRHLRHHDAGGAPRARHGQRDRHQREVAQGVRGPLHRDAQKGARQSRLPCEEVTDLLSCAVVSTAAIESH
mmetsp:Transcript_12434/g.38691  ORF Transcript_12434/g.38691 Transcript_12434/m.38691 type:complete len:473 (-) Transcript_12434:24-1442(-)